MSARFIRRGAYEVRHAGLSLTVLAHSPCEALIIAARHFKIGYETEPRAA
jgi:hypothetical protein